MRLSDISGHIRDLCDKCAVCGHLNNIQRQLSTPQSYTERSPPRRIWISQGNATVSFWKASKLHTPFSTRTWRVMTLTVQCLARTNLAQKMLWRVNAWRYMYSRRHMAAKTSTGTYIGIRSCRYRTASASWRKQYGVRRRTTGGARQRSTRSGEWADRSPNTWNSTSFHLTRRSVPGPFAIIRESVDLTWASYGLPLKKNWWSDRSI